MRQSKALKVNNKAFRKVADSFEECQKSVLYVLYTPKYWGKNSAASLMPTTLNLIWFIRTWAASSKSILNKKLGKTTEKGKREKIDFTSDFAHFHSLHSWNNEKTFSQNVIKFLLLYFSQFTVLPLNYYYHFFAIVFIRVTSKSERHKDILAFISIDIK